jgi:sigma-E factor negative regulatory protein RseC
MTQDAIVVKILPNSMAEVVVTRSTACGSNCGNCESCIFQSELKTLARNSIGAKPGQKVVISSSSRRIFSAAALVYIMPLLFFLVGFAVSSLLGASEGICVLVSFLSLILSAFVLIISQKNKTDAQQITFDIIS